MKIKFALFFFIIFSISVQAQTLLLSEFASGIKKPIGIENCQDDRLFVLEQAGLIKILDTEGKVLATPFLDIQSKIKSSGNEQGLLGLAFHPDYKNNGYFFLNYSNLNGHTVIARYKVSSDENVADADSEKIILTINQPYPNHNGGCLTFGKDGCLYIGMGDGGAGGDPKNSGQTKQSLLGKMLRIDVDTDAAYKIPLNNPFVDDDETLDEIWALGVRNPWKFSFDPLNGDLWIADVGQNKWEEIDFQPGTSKGGENYGWRCYEATHEYNTADCEGASSYVPPIFEYENNAQYGCSVTGGLVYRGAKYNSLQGKYLFTDYCSGNIWATEKKENGFDTKLLGKFEAYNYTAFGQDQYGEMYLAERETGKIMKIAVDECKPSAFIWVNGNTTIINKGDFLRASFNPDNSYQWLKDAVAISGATSHEYEVNETGQYQVVVTNSSNCSDTSELVSVNQIITSVGRPVGIEMKLNYHLGTLKINLNEKLTANSISVIDMTGKEVLNISGSESDHFELSADSLKKGQTYLLRLESSKGRLSEVFVVD